MKGGLPFESAVGLQFHAEERVRQRGEVVVVYAGIDERRRQADLADVILDGELGAPVGEGGPALAVDAVIGHAAVDIVLDAGLLGGVGQRATDGDLVAPRGGVDEGQLGADEQVGYEVPVFERTDDQTDVFERLQLLCHEAIFGAELGAHAVADGGGDAREGGCLSTAGVDNDDRLRGHPGPSG